MCWPAAPCCHPGQFPKDFECKIEETEDGVIIRIKAKDPKKLEAFKKMLAAHKELCGDVCG